MDRAPTDFRYRDPMAPESRRADYKAILKKAYVELKAKNAEIEALRAGRSRPIAVVGYACRFPQAPSVEAYWRLLSGGFDAVRTVPADPWKWEAFPSEDLEAPHRTYPRGGGL